LTVFNEQSAGTVYLPCFSEKVSLLYYYPFLVKEEG